MLHFVRVPGQDKVTGKRLSTAALKKENDDNWHLEVSTSRALETVFGDYGFCLLSDECEGAMLGG